MKSSKPCDRALLDAIRQGDVQSVQSLLDEGANANAHDAKGEYAISLAAKSPVVMTTYGMQTEGRCVTIKKHRGYEAITTALLWHGANTRVHNTDHYTPLQQVQSLRRRTSSPFSKMQAQTSSRDDQPTLT